MSRRENWSVVEGGGEARERLPGANSVSPADNRAIDATAPDPVLLARVIDAIETEHFFPALRDFINGLVAIDNCVALVFASDKPPLKLHQWSPQEPNYFDLLYCQGAYVLDPFYQLCLARRDGGTFLLDDIAPDSFNESDFYRTYYHKVQMIDEIGLLFPVDEARTIHLSLGRRANSLYYSDEDVDRIRHLAPLLESLIKRHVRMKLEWWKADGNEITVAGSLTGQWLSPYNVTSREAEIAAMVLRGHSNTSIGLTLSISVETVKVHRRNLYGKVKISSQAELFLLFIDYILESGDVPVRTAF